VQDEALRGGATGEAVHVLGFLGRAEGRDDEALGVAALEERAAVNAGEHADFGGDRADRRGVAAVGADAAIEDGLAVRLVLEFLEDDVEIDVGELAFAELGEEGGLGLFLEGVDVGGAHGFFESEDGGRDALGRDNALDDGAGLGRAPTRLNLAFGLPARATSWLMAAMIGWIALCANSERSTKRSSVNWSALPSIMSMSFALPT